MAISYKIPSSPSSIPNRNFCEPSLARGYKTFFMLNSTEHEISTAHKQMKKFLALSLSDSAFIMLINVKMAKMSAQDMQVNTIS